jgi:hypothetical protein
MKAESGPNRFVVSPAKSILIFDLSVIVIVLAMLVVMPINFSIKCLFIALLANYCLITCRSFKQEENTELCYLPSINKWEFDGKQASLRKQQFITRNLMVLYFLINNGEKLSQIIPIDSMQKKTAYPLEKVNYCLVENP